MAYEYSSVHEGILMTAEQRHTLEVLVKDSRLYYMGDCPECGLYLPPPFDGWCPKCGKQTIGDQPTRYGEVEAMCWDKLHGEIISPQEWRQRVHDLEEKEQV